eukprot:TRINITY_DN5177_c0_g1_i1.p1 TRINITY_DN5177_c0_g1~~TRINITY_DN5177_c0_g1_i1.p1  ORF type:complete len:579 (-),score=107.86 TRINITY_DN5177_c0_g1_i1:73-1809(-)
MGGCSSSPVEPLIVYHPSPVRAVVLSPDGSYAATLCSDHAVSLYDINQAQSAFELRGHSNLVKRACFTPDSRYLITASLDCTARVWSMADRSQVAEIIHSAAVQFCGLSPNGQVMITITRDHNAYFWANNFKTSSLGANPPVHKISGCNTYCSFSPDSELVAFPLQSGHIRIVELSSGDFRQVAQIVTHSFRLGSFSSPESGSSLLSASSDGIVELFKKSTGYKAATLLNGASGLTNSSAFSPDGRLVVAGGADHVVRIWDAETGKMVAAMRGHNDVVRMCAFSPSGRIIATASADGTVRVWSVAGSRALAVLRDHTRGVNTVVFSEDGLRLASTSNDGKCVIRTVARMAGVEAVDKSLSRSSTTVSTPRRLSSTNSLASTTASSLQTETLPPSSASPPVSPATGVTNAGSDVLNSGLSSLPPLESSPPRPPPPATPPQMPSMQSLMQSQQPSQLQSPPQSPKLSLPPSQSQQLPQQVTQQEQSQQMQSQQEQLSLFVSHEPIVLEFDDAPPKPPAILSPTGRLSLRGKQSALSLTAPTPSAASAPSGGFASAMEVVPQTPMSPDRNSNSYSNAFDLG